MSSFDTGSFIEALGTYPAWMWALIALLVVLCVVAGILQVRRQRRLRESVLQSEPIPAKEFLGNWITAKSGHRAAGGYKLMDRPGCYVILTNPRDDGRGGQDYDGVYVGQSVKVCSRVRAHLTGHGNGDVYADVRDGRDVVVRIIPCPAEEMNARELCVATCGLCALLGVRWVSRQFVYLRKRNPLSSMRALAAHTTGMSPRTTGVRAPALPVLCKSGCGPES